MHRIKEGSVAAQCSELRVGDMVLKVNDQDFRKRDKTELHNYIRNLPVGDQLWIEVSPRHHRRSLSGP